MLVRCIPLLRPVPNAGLLTALFVLAAMLITAALPAAAQDQSGGDVFTVERVPVDVTATNSALAREQGIREGQRDAFNRLFDRLTLDEDSATPPPMGPAEIERLVESFEVGAERSSSVRYVAEITVRFRPSAVRALMLSSGIRYAEVRSKPVLVLPIDMTGPDPVLWQQETPWRLAWENFTPPVGLLPILVPYGELQDVTDIGAAEALAGDEQALRRIADRYEAGAVAVARVGLDGELEIPSFPDPNAPTDPTAFLAAPAPDIFPPADMPVETEPLEEPVPEAPRPRGLMVVTTLHRFQGTPDMLVVELPPPAALPDAEPLPGAEQPPAEPGPSIFGEPPEVALPGAEEPVEVPAGLPPGVLELIPLAVERTATAMEQNWIARNLLETGQESVLPVRVPLAGLNEWMETRTRLGQVATVTRTRLLALSRDAAEVELYYLGDSDRLRTALAQRDLLLERPPAPLPGQGAVGLDGQDQDLAWRLQWRGAAGAQARPTGFGAEAPAQVPAASPEPYGFPAEAPPPDLDPRAPSARIIPPGTQ